MGGDPIISPIVQVKPQGFDQCGRQGVHGRDAVPDENLVEGQGTLGGYETHPWRRRGPPGTRDLFPGDGVGSHGTRGSHGKHRLRD